MVVTIQDMDIDVAFTPDHKFTALAARQRRWKIDGDKLCTTTPEQGESCTTIRRARSPATSSRCRTSWLR